MTNEQISVRNWMLAGGQECPKQPLIPSKTIGKLRVNLIKEELDELDLALWAVYNRKTPSIEDQLIATADAITDLMVVVLGTANACGLDMQPFFEEVMRSNYTKLVRNSMGKLTCVKNGDGKILKPATYELPNLMPILEYQIKNPLV